MKTERITLTRLDYAITARCRPEHVWQVFANIDRWPQWNPVIGKSHWLTGEQWQLGSRFFMEITQPRRISFKPEIVEIDPPRRIVWTGSAPGFKGTHGHEFVAQPDGTTLIKTWEEFSGLATIFFTKGMKKKLINMYAVWLNSLAAESEKLEKAQVTADETI
jgi:hypothetical protein